MIRVPFRRTAEPAPQRPAPPDPYRIADASAFDLFEGEFERQQKARMGTSVLLTVAAAATLVAGTAAWQNWQGTDELEQAALALAQQRTALSAELAELAGGAGLSEQEIVNYAETRREQVGAALAAEVDAFGVVDAVLASAPAGITVQSVSFSSGHDDSPVQASVSGSAASLETLAAWESSLQQTGLLESVTTDWSGGSDTVSVTTTAGLNGAAQGVRRTAVLDGPAPAPLDSGPPPDPAAPTGPDTPPAGGDEATRQSGDPGQGG